jgi:hypothetical protein
MSDSDSILAFLCIATSLNLALLVWTWRTQPARRALARDLMFPVGIPVAPFSGRSRSGTTVEIRPDERLAFAMVFLSRGCPKCRSAVHDVVAAARDCRGRPVRLWIATDERLTAAELGQPPECDGLFLDLSEITYSMLNPRHFSPGYLFIGADLVVEASGAIGDANWQSFAAQLAEPPEQRSIDPPAIDR